MQWQVYHSIGRFMRVRWSAASMSFTHLHAVTTGCSYLLTFQPIKQTLCLLWSHMNFHVLFQRLCDAMQISFLGNSCLITYTYLALPPHSCGSMHQALPCGLWSFEAPTSSSLGSHHGDLYISHTSCWMPSVWSYCLLFVHSLIRNQRILSSNSPSHQSWVPLLPRKNS